MLVGEYLGLMLTLKGDSLSSIVRVITGDEKHQGTSNNYYRDITMSAVTLGVFRRTAKDYEQRLPIHPDHFASIPKALRPQLMLEEGYGAPFGISDAHIADEFGGVMSGDQLFAQCDGILLTKPQAKDLEKMRDGQFLWGWPHCVQNLELTQASIDKRLTIIAWEHMNQWTASGEWLQHAFFKNNEIAGLAAVNDACRLVGVTGFYGAKRSAVVIGSGSVSRGAVAGLQHLGITDICMIVKGNPLHMSHPPLGVEFMQLVADGDEAVVIVRGNVCR